MSIEFVDKQMDKMIKFSELPFGHAFIDSSGDIGIKHEKKIDDNEFYYNCFIIRFDNKPSAFNYRHVDNSTVTPIQLKISSEQQL